MIFLRKMRGILEMHLSVQTIQTCKKVFMKQQNIWKCFLETFFWNKRTFEWRKSGHWRCGSGHWKRTFHERQRFFCKTTVHIHRLFEKFGFDGVFGRSAVMELLELKSSGASEFLSNLVQADIIEPVSGHGKGKYKFNKISLFII